MQLVDLADEYELTTAEAIDICLAAGIPAETSETDLDGAQTSTWRNVAEQQRAWRLQAAAAKDAARQAAEAARSQPSSFGPIPPVPWDHAGRSTEPGISIAPQTTELGASDLDPDWGGASSGQVSLYAAGALALAVVSLVFPFVPAILAIPIAVFARSQIEKSRGAVTGDKLAVAAMVVSGIGIALWLSLVGIALYNERQDQAAKNEVIDLQVDTRTITWDQLKVGDCVRLPHGDALVGDWQGVSCEAPHEGEVFASLKASTNSRAEFPGRGALYSASKDECVKEFERYVGVPYRESRLKVSAYFPTAENWIENGDRNFGCIVHEDGFGLVNGSLANAQR